MLPLSSQTVPLIFSILLQHHASKLFSSFWSTFRVSKFQHHTMLCYKCSFLLEQCCYVHKTSIRSELFYLCTEWNCLFKEEVILESESYVLENTSHLRYEYVFWCVTKLSLFVRSCFVLKTNALSYVDTCYQTVRHQMPGDCNLRSHRHDNLKYFKILIIF